MVSHVVYVSRHTYLCVSACERDKQEGLEPGHRLTLYAKSCRDYIVMKSIVAVTELRAAALLSTNLRAVTRTTLLYRSIIAALMNTSFLFHLVLFCAAVLLHSDSPLASLQNRNRCLR